MKRPCGAFKAERHSSTFSCIVQSARWSNERSNQNPSVPRCKEEEICAGAGASGLCSPHKLPTAPNWGGRAGYLIRILPPLLPIVGVVGGNGQITNGGVEPHIENLRTQQKS